MSQSNTIKEGPGTEEANLSDRYTDLPKSSRKHVTTACKLCRESKTKCDGQKPVCGSCKKKKKACQYLAKDDKRKVSLRTAIDLLSARVEQLSRFIAQHGLDVPSMGDDEQTLLEQISQILELPILETGSSLSRTPAIVDKKTTSSPAPQFYQQEEGTPQMILPRESTNTNAYDHFEYAVQDAFNPNDQMQDWSAAQPENIIFEDTPPDWIWDVFDNSTGVLAPLTKPATTHALMGSLVPGSEQASTFDQDQGKMQSNNVSVDDEVDSRLVNQLAARIGSLQLASDGRLRYYGTASNYHLLEGSRSQRELAEPRATRQEAKQLLERANLAQEIPPTLQQHLTELFFTWHDPCHSDVDRAAYEAAQAAYDAGEENNSYYSQVLTNVICAIGSAFEARYHPTFITFPKPLAEFFADRAKVLLEMELDSPCVATVQALNLLSSHEAASGRDARMWLYSGMAMRLSFDLGLHIDSTAYVQQGIMTASEAEARRSTFWGCVIVNHLWSFYLGRPFRVDSEEVTVSRPAGLMMPSKSIWQAYPLDTRVPHASTLSQGLPDLRNLVAEQWIYFCDELAPLVRTLYGCASISPDSLQLLSTEVTARLGDWENRLPESLKVDQDRICLPHVLMLHMAYRHFQILLHRPWTATHSQPTPGHGPGFSHARNVCITSASIIASLLLQYERYYSFRRMNVYVVNIVFSASLILMFGMVVGRKHEDEELRNQSIVANLSTCFRALDELGQAYECAKTTRESLLTIQRRWNEMRRRGIPTWKKRTRSQPRAPADDRKRSKPSTEIERPDLNFTEASSMRSFGHPYQQWHESQRFDQQ